MDRLKSRFLAIAISHALIAQAWGQAPDPGQDASDLNSYLQSTNPHLREHAYVLLASKWKKTHLTVCWDNPSPQFQRAMSLVQQEIQETWGSPSISKLTFTGWEKCAVPNRGIHIFIDDSGPETQKLGRQIDGLVKGMVLNFMFVAWGQGCRETYDYCVKAIAGHEFGHAVGFAHEQNRPDKAGECRLPPSGERGDSYLLTPYDPHSIMNYCNSRYNNDGKLSALDVDALQQLYGPPVSKQGRTPARTNRDIARATIVFIVPKVTARA